MAYVCAGVELRSGMESMKLEVIGKGCGCSVTKMKSVDLRIPLDWVNLDLLFLQKPRAYLNI